MANVYAVKSGNWSDPTVWDTGALPTANDDVWANNFTVTIDISPTVLSIRNGASSPIISGGTFVPTNGITLTCTASTGFVVNAVTLFISNLTSGQSCNILANIVGASGANGISGFINNSSGTVNIVGNVRSGTGGNGHGVVNASTGIINIIGNVTTGIGGASHGVVNSSIGTINITGSVTGGPGAAGGVQVGVLNTLAGTINITGNVIGGSANGGNGVTNSSSGTVNITGILQAGSAAITAGVLNNSTGLVNHVGIVQATISSPAINAGSSSQTTILTGPFLCASNAVQACIAQRWKLNANTSSTYLEVQTNNPSIKRNLYTADYVGGNPPISDVRAGTIFGPNDELEGTCIIPPTSSVQFGVPVDDTVGTGNFGGDAETFWAVPLADLEAGSSGSIGKLVNKIPTPELIGEYLAAFDRV